MDKSLSFSQYKKVEFLWVRKAELEYRSAYETLPDVVFHPSSIQGRRLKTTKKQTGNQGVAAVTAAQCSSVASREVSHHSKWLSAPFEVNT
jgi:hypothetical protein